MNETTYRLLSNTACKAEWELSMKNDRSVEVSAEQYNPVSKTTRNAQWKLSRKGWAICWPFGEELETQSKRISDPRSHTPTNTAGNPLWKPSGSERISQSNTARKLLRKQSMKELAIWQDIHWEIRQWTCGECSQPKERVIRWDGHKAILCTNGWETRRCEVAWANCPAIHRGIWCSNCGGCPRAEVWGI